VGIPLLEIVGECRQSDASPYPVQVFVTFFYQKIESILISNYFKEVFTLFAAQ
jgi:hypothetical protein